jgi:hypothetical protein
MSQESKRCILDERLFPHHPIWYWVSSNKFWMDSIFAYVVVACVAVRESFDERDPYEIIPSNHAEVHDFILQLEAKALKDSPYPSLLASFRWYANECISAERKQNKTKEFCDIIQLACEPSETSLKLDDPNLVFLWASMPFFLFNLPLQKKAHYKSFAFGVKLFLTRWKGFAIHFAPILETFHWPSLSVVDPKHHRMIEQACQEVESIWIHFMYERIRLLTALSFLPSDLLLLIQEYVCVWAFDTLCCQIRRPDKSLDIPVPTKSCRIM